MSNTINDLIGKHPDLPDFFAEWLKCENVDIPVTNPTKKHRKLDAKDISRKKAIEQAAFWIIRHHISNAKLEFLKSKRKLDTYSKYFDKSFVEKQRLIPIRTQNTQSGALADIVMSEYLQKATGFTNFIYKLQYNPNVEQSMKGDDVLLFDEKNLEGKIIVGESKFRQNTSKAVIDEILSGFGGAEPTLPLSISFVAEMLSKETANIETANKLYELQMKISELKDKILWVGFIMSNKKVHKAVENDDWALYKVTQDVFDELYKVGFPKNTKHSLIYLTKTEIPEFLKVDIKTEKGYKKAIDTHFSSKTKIITKEIIQELKDLGFPYISEISSMSAEYKTDKTFINAVNNTLKREKIELTISKLDDEVINYWEQIITQDKNKSYNNQFVFMTLAANEPDVFLKDVYEEASKQLSDIDTLHQKYNNSLHNSIDIVKQKALEIAEKAINEGIEDKVIMKITGLSLSEIENLKLLPF